MIWFRRTIAVILALIVIILFVVMMAVFRVNDTAGNPNFYTEQLRRAEMYDFVVNEAIPAAVDEVDLSEGGSEEDPGNMVDLDSIKPYMADMVRQILPPEWLQARVEEAINETLPYVLGDTDSFSFTIPLKDRVEVSARAIKDTLHKEDVFPKFYDRFLGQMLDGAAQSMADMPPAFALDRQELETMVRTVAPPEWVLEQIDKAIDQMVPYLTGDREHFTVQVNLSERLDAMEEVAAGMLKRPQTYDYIFESVVVPAIKQNIQQSVQLPLGIVLSDEEILQATRESLPLDWYQARADDIVGQIFAYLRGSQETVEVAIPLSDRKPAITSTLSNLADQKLKSLFDVLPVCTPDQLLRLIANPPLDRAPECKPAGISYAELRALLHIDFRVILAPLVEVWVPNQWVFTESDLQEALGEQENDVLSQARDWIQKGMAFTEEDLGDALGDSAQKIDEVRDYIVNGFTFNEQKLRELMEDTDGGQGSQLQSFDNVRSNLGTVRKWRMAAWAIPGLLLIGIGLLGGRRWSTKLIWAAAALAVAGIVALVVYGPVFSAVAQPRVDEALAQATSEAEGVQLLVVQKGAEIAHNVIGTFIGPLRVQAIGLVMIGLALAGVGSLWYIRSRRIEGENKPAGTPGEPGHQPKP